MLTSAATLPSGSVCRLVTALVRSGNASIRAVQISLPTVRTVGKLIWTDLIDAFPDLTNAVTSLRADVHGNVAAEVSIAGTQARAFGGIACTGQRYRLPHLFLFRVTGGGLIDDIVAYWDNVAWKKQLGCLEVD